MSKLTDNTLNEMTYSVADVLKQYGADFTRDSDLLQDLNDNLQAFLSEKVGIEIVDELEFKDLEGEKQKIWVDLAYKVSKDEGVEVSPEETEKKAEYLFEIENGEIPSNLDTGSKRTVAVTLSFEISGQVDDSLIDHLGQVCEGGYIDASNEGMVTPQTEKYEETVVSLDSVTSCIVE